MSTRDDAVEYANYYRDTPSLCVVEVADETFVVTNTVAQAEALRATLDGLRGALRAYVTAPKPAAPEPTPEPTTVEDKPPVKRTPRKQV